MRITTARTLAPVALAAVLTFTLTGCFSNPLEGLLEGGIENIIEDQTGVDIDVDGSGNGASLPDSWPSDVPVPDGKIVSSMAIDGTFSASIQVSDDAAAQAGLDALLDAGFESESEMDMGELKIFGLFDATTGISYSWITDEEAGEVFVTMTVSPRE
jgi:hypothetical protein